MRTNLTGKNGVIINKSKQSCRIRLGPNQVVPVERILHSMLLLRPFRKIPTILTFSPPSPSHTPTDTPSSTSNLPALSHYNASLREEPLPRAGAAETNAGSLRQQDPPAPRQRVSLRPHHLQDLAARPEALHCHRNLPRLSGRDLPLDLHLPLFEAEKLQAPQEDGRFGSLPSQGGCCRNQRLRSRGGVQNYEIRGGEDF